MAVPLWALVLLCLFAAVTFASHFLFPSVRWFFRRQAEALVARLNTRLKRPIQPFKLARRIDTINRLVHDPQVAQAVLDRARDEGIPEEVAYEDARRYAREIVPGFSALLYFGVATRLARWLSRSLYRVRVTGEEEAMAGLPADATVVFVLNHRSNVDYVLLTWLVAQRTALAFAVGEWAARWPLQPLIRAMGGYFVRRRNLNPLYRRVLARYVQLATRGGVTQAIFPEGRLSRTGALGPPKLGILSYLMSDADPGGAQDVVFVPVAVNYERVFEDTKLIAAEARGNAAFRLRWWMVGRYIGRQVQRRLTGRFSRFGYAAVAFGEPLSLRSFARRDLDDPAAALGDALMKRLSATLPVLPLPLACRALLDGAREVEAVRARMETDAARWRKAGHMVHSDRDDPTETTLAALRMLEVRGVIRRTESHVEPVERWTPILDYYARTLPRCQEYR